jgi:SAM-dependent methyltransferase
MATITQGMNQQYADSAKLAARARLHSFGHAQVPWFTWVARHVPMPEQGGSVLDVGCGPAWFWPEAAQVLPAGIRLTLFDQSSGMVEEAMERCRGLALAGLTGKTGDAVELPFADNSFDAVIAMHMLYHVADQEKAMAEFGRVLKPGGALVVTTNGIDNMRELYALTTIFGSAPHDPSADAFGLDRAQQLMRAAFGNVMLEVHPATMRVTDPETVFLALTSYPPGDTAPPEQQQAFRHAIEDAFTAGSGGIDVTKEVGVLVSRKGA